MDRTPNWLNWDSANFVFLWPKRLAGVADQIQKLHVQAISLGYLVGVGAAKDWDYTDNHCLIAAMGAWISLILPKALEGTALLWIRHKGIKMMEEAFRKELPKLSPEEAQEHRAILKKKCDELMRQTGG